MRHVRKVKESEPNEQELRLTTRLLRGEPIQTAMLAENYKPSVARLGKQRLPKAVLRLMKKTKQDNNLLELGKITAAEQENIVRSRLVYNTLVGQDKGVNSAKALGSDRRVNMFTPESQTGIVVLGDLQIGQATEDKLLQAPEEE